VQFNARSHRPARRRSAEQERANIAARQRYDARSRIVALSYDGHRSRLRELLTSPRVLVRDALGGEGWKDCDWQAISELSMALLPTAAALPLCRCWRASRAWPLRSMPVSARMLRSSAPQPPASSRLLLSVRERATSHGGARRTFGVFSAAGAYARGACCAQPWFGSRACGLTAPLLRQPLQGVRLTARRAPSAACTSSLAQCLRGRRRRFCAWCRSTRRVGRSAGSRLCAACASLPLPHRGFRPRRATARRWWWSSPIATGDTPLERWSAMTACGGCAPARGGDA